MKDIVSQVALDESIWAAINVNRMIRDPKGDVRPLSLPPDIFILMQYLSFNGCAVRQIQAAGHNTLYELHKTTSRQSCGGISVNKVGRSRSRSRHKSDTIESAQMVTPNECYLQWDAYLFIKKTSSKSLHQVMYSASRANTTGTAKIILKVMILLISG